MEKRSKKKFVILSVTAVVIVALLVGLWLFLQHREDQKTVEVIPVSQIAESYWPEQTSSSGMVVNDYLQELYPDKSKKISQIFVEEGQEVSIGDPLLQYDQTMLEWDVRVKENALQESGLQIKAAQKQLAKLQNTKPVSTPGPTRAPTPTPRPTRTPRPTPTPRPGSIATPTPTPVPPGDAIAYSRLDLKSKPYSGSGTSQDPYVFLCTSDCMITPDFLKWLLGMWESATPTPAPTPTPSPSLEPETSSDLGDETSGVLSFPEEETPPTPTPTPEPTATPRPSDLKTPFSAIFEVRDGNSNYGQLISSFKLDGAQLSGQFQLPDTLTGYNTLESIASLFGATPTPKPTAEPNNYNDMGYTASELQKLIQEKKQEITNLQLAQKQAQLELDKSNLLLRNSTVLSTVDGTVRTLLDPEAAAAEGKPFLTVSGGSGTYVIGAISETMLESIHVGDQVTVMDYNMGNTYTAEIVSIADYPLGTDSNLYYYGSDNPNSSRYEFTAVVDGGEDLQSNAYVDITLNSQTEEASDALFIQKAYIREDERGSYVMKSGVNNRLVKQYVQTGRSLYGYSLEIKSGLTIDDYIAFPYGADVKEGVRVQTPDPDEEGGATLA